MRAAPILIALICAVVSVHGGALKTFSGRAGACSLSVTGGLGEPQPLLITPGTTNFKRSADTKGTLSFEANEAVLLACPGTGNYLTVSSGQWLFKRSIIIMFLLSMTFPGRRKWSPRGHCHLLRGHVLRGEWCQVRLQHVGLQQLSRARATILWYLFVWQDFDRDRICRIHGLRQDHWSVPWHDSASLTLHQVHTDQGCCWISDWNRSSWLVSRNILFVSFLNCPLKNGRPLKILFIILLQRCWPHQSVQACHTADYLHHAAGLCHTCRGVHSSDQRLLPLQGTFGGQGWLPVRCSAVDHLLVH